MSLRRIVLMSILAALVTSTMGFRGGHMRGRPGGGSRHGGFHHSVHHRHYSHHAAHHMHAHHMHMHHVHHVMRRHFVFHTVVFGAWVLSRPSHTTVVYVNAAPYYYADGVYYVKKSETCYVTVPSPQGAVIQTLPEGAVQVQHGGGTYYYWNGCWYVRTNSYTVVAAPIGATATFLPKNAEKKTIGGTTYFVYGGAYYVAKFIDGLTLYQVVAKPGTQAESPNILETLPEDKLNVEFNDATYYYVDGVWYADADGGYSETAPPVGASVPYLPEDTVEKDGYFFSKGVYYETYTKEGVELYKVARTS